MLSEKAFNAFLKTLEEPPPHAKFVFATTEIRKVPVTILSRCQRFDLRRIDASLLVDHLGGICRREGVTIEPEALSMIARAAEGSARDSLSLLDQAIAHGAGRIDAETVRGMLGLADRARVVDLFDLVVRGDVAGALKELRDQYDSGADPAIILTDLAEFTHLVTRLKIVPGAAADATLTETERRRGQEFATLPMRVLSRFWQMLTRGIGEVQSSPKPVAAAEMVLIRLAYAADLPTPDDLIRQLQSNPPAGGSATTQGGGGSGGGGSGGGGAPRGSAAALQVATRSEPRPMPQAEQAAQPAMRLARFEDLVALAAEKRDIAMKLALERDVRLVRFEDGRLEFAASEGASPQLAADLSRRLGEWTGRRWIVALSSEPGQPTLRETHEARERDRRTGIRSDPLVRAVLERFPGAEIVAIRDVNAAPASDDEDALPADGGVPYDIADDEFDGFEPLP
jgi:DNA polymerase-3 subunit gamma/tau